MPVITLTSDWNQKDYYLAAVKGQILRKNDNLTIVDLNHNIQAYNSRQAAFILRNSSHNFPEGSVHINFVNAESPTGDSYYAILAQKHFFIGNDNGSFSMIINGPPDKIVKLKPLENITFKSFPGIITFTDAACKLIEQQDISMLG
ncbi:MAG: SAM-dependent chlorinase/fluorinase, partial [Bacteroidota bacterium]